MVFALSALIARDLLSDYRDWAEGVSAGPIHDIGKICVPPHILRKAAPLTKDEKPAIDHHTVAGYVLLSFFHKDTNNLAAIVARDHHERRDGSGVPRGIQLTDRMVEIIVVCDVYDALVSPRPYRPVCYSNRTAIEEITRMAGTRLDGKPSNLSWHTTAKLSPHAGRQESRLKKEVLLPNKISMELLMTPTGRADNRIGSD
jgi:HD-GYP domain-containing protein (c-di-GMP phosphodiesterase class II)